MKSFPEILALFFLLLIVTEKGCLAKTTKCTEHSDFFHDENCQCDVDKVCIRKCCPENRILENKEDDTVNCVDGPYRENVWEKRWDGNRADIRALNSPDTHLVVGFPPCPSFLSVDENDTFTANRKGELIYNFIAYSKFCMDFSYDSGTVLAVVCEDQFSLKPPSVPRVSITLLMVSILFMLITFFVYAVEAKLRTLQGKCLMCYLLCAISYSAILCLIRGYVLEKETTVCYWAGYLTLYCLLAGFFWLNVMCFDLCLALKRLVHRTGDVKNFLLYSLYAWGSPLVVVCVAILAQFSVIPWLPVKPTFGENNCWFTAGVDKTAHILYFDGISIFLWIVNLLFFIRTVYIIETHNGQKKHFQKHESKRNTEKEKRRSFLFLKLFFMMGLNWIGEFLPNHIDMPEEISFVVGIPNLLQGFFIFVIFACKRRVLALLNERLYPSKIFVEERKPRKSSTQTLLSRMNTIISLRASSTRGPVFPSSAKAGNTLEYAARGSLSSP